MFPHRLAGRAIAIACFVGILASNAAAQHLASIGGWVYIDRNNDGQLAFANQPNPEFVIPDVRIDLFSLVGSVETPVTSMLTDANGRYFFDNLAAGTYVVREEQPIEFVDGKDTLGQLFTWSGGPVPPGTSAGVAGNDVFSNIVLQPDVKAEYYLFGELGLKAGYASKRYLFASAPPMNTVIPEPTSIALVLVAAGAILSTRQRRRS